MYYRFRTLTEAKQHITDFNDSDTAVRTKAKAKIVAWPHTQIREREFEWSVFQPDEISNDKT